MVMMFDCYGRIIYANQSAEKHLEYENGLWGVSITDIIPEAVRLEGENLYFESEPDGTFLNIQAYRENRTCFPLRTKLFCCEELHTYICTGYDVSEKTLLEKQVTQAGQEAEEALKVKSEFVANVTHELRTPVNGILGNTRELLDMENEPEKLKMLQMIERGCKDMHALINNILDFSKLEAGKFVLEPREFSFRNMIDYIKGNHSKRIIEKGLEFSVNVSDEVPEHIIGDELRIVQVLNNLISNAYKFTSVGGITLEVIKTAQYGNRVELFFMVIDSGIGIAVADQDKLFKSFSQVDASISRKYGGTGLGLNICKQLVELMDGSIHVKSDSGKGAIFSFHIWVKVPENGKGLADGDADEKRMQSMATRSEQELLNKLQSLTENNKSDKIRQYGEAENKEELEKKMSKLILSVEMENWEKAEMFAETVKQLLEEAPREIKTAALRMKMAVQKGNYEKTVTAFEQLRDLINEEAEK
ncbi:MAG: hypothetical protein IJ485_05105 [Lachnospiraceae bacterium]|nr:hypothetical protein [Lachnospiraceae bacterium]